jgi:hypothetical protein
MEPAVQQLVHVVCLPLWAPVGVDIYGSKPNVRYDHVDEQSPVSL